MVLLLLRGGRIASLVRSRVVAMHSWVPVDVAILRIFKQAEESRENK
jgi:hypothetical protein